MFDFIGWLWNHTASPDDTSSAAGLFVFVLAMAALLIAAAIAVLLTLTLIFKSGRALRSLGQAFTKGWRSAAPSDRE